MTASAVRLLAFALALTLGSAIVAPTVESNVTGRPSPVEPAASVDPASESADLEAPALRLRHPSKQSREGSTAERQPGGYFFATLQPTVAVAAASWVAHIRAGRSVRLASLDRRHRVSRAPPLLEFV